MLVRLVFFLLLFFFHALTSCLAVFPSFFRYMMDVEGMPLLDATVTSDGKLWSPHTEALIALTMAFTRTKDVKWLDWLEKVHKYSYDTFVDVRINESTVRGEWFGYALRSGKLSRTSKGGNYKGCFHVPRALLLCSVEAENFLNKDGSGACYK